MKTTVPTYKVKSREYLDETRHDLRRSNPKYPTGVMCSLSELQLHNYLQLRTYIGRVLLDSKCGFEYSRKSIHDDQWTS